MNHLIDSFLALPTLAHVLIASVVVAALYRILRTRVFKTTAAARSDIEFAAWNEVLAPKGWVGTIERGLTTDDVNILFEEEGSSGGRTFRLMGKYGTGSVELYGIPATRHKFELDLESALEVGVSEALRVTRNAAMFAALLGRDGEEALAGLPASFEKGSCALLEMNYLLSVTWGVSWDDTHDPQATAVVDRTTFYERLITFEGALRAREIGELGAAELSDLARSGGPIASALAARVLLSLHPTSEPASDLVRDLVAGRLDEALERWLPGCVFDADIVSALGLSREEHIELAREAVVRADEACGLELARAAIDVYGVDAFVGQGLARFDEDERKDLTFEQLKLLQRRMQHDAHIFACHVVAAFRGNEDADAFEDVYTRVLGQIEHDFEFQIEFGEVMGDIDAWHPESIARALAHASNDHVYCYWAQALPDVWDARLASRLVTLLDSQHAEDGVLEALGLVAIVEAATSHDHVLMLSRAKLAYARIKDDWSSNDDDTRKMHEALDSLESRFMDVRHEGAGQLSLSANDGTGGISLSTRGAEGDLLAVLDASDDEETDEAAAEHAEAEAPIEW